MDRVKGKVAVVTGAARGIGRACALRLAEEGAAVAVTDLLDDEGQGVVDEIAEAGGRAAYWKLDVSDEAAVERVFNEVAERWGRLDTVVNNAGIAGPAEPTDKIDEADWDRLFAVNVKGVFFGTKHAVPHLREAGGGSIINMSSIYGLVGAADAPAYHAAKGAVTLMSKNDALLYAGEDIRVNAVHPGFIRTPMVEQADAAADGRMIPAVTAKTPVGRLGDPDDIAWAVVYLASDESRFVTGSSLVVDGGYTAK
jgi:NAD(P)-dependent dehydrogenase (short-subunit alcohol dehydrogenase family)